MIARVLLVLLRMVLATLWAHVEVGLGILVLVCLNLRTRATARTDFALRRVAAGAGRHYGSTHARVAAARSRTEIAFESAVTIRLADARKLVEARAFGKDGAP